mgnify:FL=1|tara:strand:- start:4077 stop:4619 length:543 start_codon:yes stop_codon:yes gene_type:complete
MLLQNIELYETNQFQYLLIHKNGSSSVVKSIENLNATVTNKVNLNKIKWTVIRDPYERFIAGLKYDLSRHSLNIKDINYSSLHNSNVNLITRDKGNVNHTASQVPYLINTHIDWYIELKDLHTFLKMHFGIVEYCNIDKNNIELNLDKEEIMKYLNLDYYVYNNIINSPNLWKWQQGKIF